jgi:hypothetical protein
MRTIELGTIGGRVFAGSAMWSGRSQNSVRISVANQDAISETSHSRKIPQTKTQTKREF